MSSNFQISGNILKVDNFEISFDYEIGEVKYWDGVYVVFLSLPRGAKEVDNVYGVNSEGELIWRIENPVQAFNLDESEQGYDYYASSIYVGINLTPTGVLSATTFFGMKYTFDHKTGKLLEKAFVK